MDGYTCLVYSRKKEKKILPVSFFFSCLALVPCPFDPTALQRLHLFQGHIGLAPKNDEILIGDKFTLLPYVLKTSTIRNH